jgi:hypothetical protein
VPDGQDKKGLQDTERLKLSLAGKSVEIKRTGNQFNFKVDPLSSEEQSLLRQRALELSDLPVFHGHVEYGYSDEYAGGVDSCPRCQASTKRHYADFIYVTQLGARAILIPAGYFCVACPSVVIALESIRNAVSAGFQFRGIAAVAYQDKNPDYFKYWNNERTTFLLDEKENIFGVMTESMMKQSPLQLPAQGRGGEVTRSQAEKAIRKRKLAKEARKRNRRR